MELMLILVTSIVCAIAVWMSVKLRRIRRKLNEVYEILTDIAAGDKDRKILAAPNDITSSICYKINEIVYDLHAQIIEFKRAEELNKQLMTSLSHDVRTPLTTLIGYLDAVNKGIVVGDEREEFIEIARLKSHALKEYVDKLFEWSKLRSDEETFVVHNVELTEMTRTILQDWLPVFESIPMKYDITIPEQQIMIQMDKNTYFRIINNLIQNVVDHSGASCISIHIAVQGTNVAIMVEDNGKGVLKQDLPFIFSRLYKMDGVRFHQGSGLGLSIVQQLVKKFKGTITVQSEPNLKTEFRICLPLVK
ncbi:sensor histidine kinase [Paenibacillus polymyxa]|uniref:sensor histidine kinase n=1 Tax=Paenibacillus polymyxa TaxID=1406 RepID=UPI00237884BC|nr:HAMP domain-containing sensor histidine kinase [Paenibacillus polymyxa]WDM22575.1 HAMP domain-containing histidine kinase [Paenibacillus polymyxa]